MSIEITVSELYDLKETIAAGLLEGLTYPWEALPKIHDFIIDLGESLPKDIYEERGDYIWVAKSAKVAPTACLNGPLIVDEDAEIRHCAFVRGNAIVGKGAVVGNSTELKNVILFNKVQVPHYNYVGDSILGFKAHMGAGSITSNVKSDKTLVVVKGEGVSVETGLKKMGGHAGRQRGGGLQQRPEPRNRRRPEHEHLSRIHGQRRDTRREHLQKGHGNCREEGMIFLEGYFFTKNTRFFSVSMRK